MTKWLGNLSTADRSRKTGTKGLARNCRPAHQAAGLADFPASSASFSASLQAFVECSSACLLSS